MDVSDRLNFRGKFRQYDADGKPYLYFIGDSVEYGSKRYVAVKPTSSKIPGTIEGDSVWKEIAGNQAFYVSERVPVNANVGDRWYKPSDAVLYTYVQEGNNKFWIDFIGGSNNIVPSRGITGAYYASNLYDYYIGVSYGGTAFIQLPSNPENGKIVIVKDESGRAGDPYKYITIQGATASDTIDRESSAIININNASLQFVYRNGWRII